jgi:hypothetical protein
MHCTPPPPRPPRMLSRPPPPPTAGRPSVLDPRLGLFDDASPPGAPAGPVGLGVGSAARGRGALPPRVSTRQTDAAVEVLATGVGLSLALFETSAEAGKGWQVDSTLVFAVRRVEVLDRIAASPMHCVLRWVGEGCGCGCGCDCDCDCDCGDAECSNLPQGCAFAQQLSFCGVCHACPTPTPFTRAVRGSEA